ncbi:hypothetical protein GQX74_015641 [Glossina fuscipes]|nr:hypothetical protein GQX74_015641 [Glossina fuscipes]
MNNYGRLKSLTGTILLIIINLPGGIALVNSPKIIIKDGNLIFESGLDRNISFRLSGRSRLNINDDYDLLDLLIQNKKGRTSTALGEGNEEWTEDEEAILKQLTSEMDSVKRRVFGPNGLQYRFFLLQNRTRVAQQLLRLYNNRLQQAENRFKILQERLEKKACLSNPCENGGSCFNIFDGFMCKCPKSFEGPTCNQDVNECALYAGTDLGCQNEAQCVNQFGSYSCICRPGWYGIHCTQRKGDCMQSSNWELCGHGICVNSNDTFGYKCICDQGWRTNGLIPACTVDVDECAVGHTACSTKCINLPGSFTCAPCAAGLTGNGINCRDLNECAENNGGCSLNPRVHCINSYGSYHCDECPLGWLGDGRTCTRASSNSDFAGSGPSTSGAIGAVASCTSNNVCHPSATCNEISNTVVCSCPPGMIGSGIGVNGCVRGSNKNCLNQPCKNGGTCLDSGNGYVCLCPLGFVQPNCTAISNACVPNPCLNGGRCIAKLGEHYQCQCTPGYTGKRCESRFNRCGGVLADPVGRLTYPTGSPYEHNVQCAWIIRTSETLVLNVTFNLFELEDSTDCRYDWLQINDGRTAADQIIGRFCGSHKPNGGNIISSTNNLYLWFKSDNSTAAQGFDLEWQSIPPQCGGVFTVTTHGTLSTPGSPGNYPKNRDCRWHLKAPYNKRLKLTFFSLNIEKHDSCNYDYVEIKDAISGHNLEKYCNSSHPQPLLLPTNEVNIHFHSDNVGSDTGFQIYYSTEERIPGCGGVYTLAEGQIQAPVLIEDSIACEYEIKVPTRESVILNFEKFQMAPDDCIKIYGVNSETREQSLQAKYCGDYEGRLPVVEINFNDVLVTFYGQSGAAFKLNYRSPCSFTFNSEEDFIYSPNYPNITKEINFCTYKINTEPNTVISLYVTDFDLKDSTLDDKGCVYTFLVIEDTMGKSPWEPYCNEKTPARDFVSKYNFLELLFRSSLTSSGRGFKIKYKAIPMGNKNCGGVYTRPGYTIRLPTDEEGLYMHDMECYWIIRAPLNKYIFLDWKSFKLEESSDCNYDYVEVYDNYANAKNSQPLGRYCDAHPPDPMLTHSRTITIKFVSDAFDAMEGFELNYEFVDVVNSCGGHIHSSGGKINSPTWPLNYTENLDCHWILNTPPGTQLELNIEIFDLEYTKDCSHDWLDIRNGGSNQSTLIGHFCGNISSVPRNIPSFTNQMYLHFHTDSFVNLRGFQLRWKVFSNGCGGNLKAKTGVITSPFYPKSYPNEADCEWRIHVPAGSVIEFTIEDFALESSSSCHYDVLELYDGSSMSHNLLVSLCDDASSRVYVTTRNEALVRFVSDDSNRERGFVLSFKANCSIILTNVFGVIESPNYGEALNRDDEDINCTWTIKAPKGNRVHLEFSHFFSLEDKHSVSIQDGNQTYQIREMYHNFNSSSDTLILKQTNNLVSFQLEYIMVGCIKTFHEMSANFTSPQYPKPYDNNLECLWEIFTSPGQGIEVTIAKLDVEDSVNCTKDALLITSHPKNPNVKERHCGHHINLIITSATHYLLIKFYSDDKGNGKGFTASYKIIKTSCGGVLSSKNGIITSPHYPNNYPQNSDCEWSLTVSPLHSIVLTIIELDIEDFSSCSMDYVDASETLDDAVEPSQLFKLCGTLETKNVTTWRSSTNSVTVRFHTDDTITSKGFKLSYHEDCGGRVILEDEGNWATKEISVVKHADVNQTCQWQLEAKDLSEHVALSITHVDLNPTWSREYRTEGECLNKGAVVYDGPSDTGPEKARFCKVHPPYLVSNGHALTLTVPLSIISEFEATVAKLSSICGFTVTIFQRSLTGKFSSPYYPSSYPVSMQCFWDINASAGNQVVLVIESMDIEESESCNNDYVEVRRNDWTTTPLGVFCGSEAPGPIGPAEILLVTFNSDSNEVVGKGFIASYNYVMHNEINGTNGVIESPGYPTKFHSDEKYSWRITVDKNYVILLNIKYILDEDIPYIKFYDGYTDIGAPIEFDNSHVVQSNTNVLYFTSTRAPFQFEWHQLSKEALRANRTALLKTTICGPSTLKIDSPLTFSSPGYPRGYADSLNCSWLIVSANPLAHVELKIREIDLEDYTECADYVEVYSSSDLQHWHSLTKMCKKTADTIVEYKGVPYLRMDFITDTYINKTGFMADINIECGSLLTERRRLVNITQLLNNRNRLRMECVWTIQVRQARRIKITFPESILMPDSSNDNNCRTYFLVRNGINEDSPFLGKGKYCDNHITDVLETSSNRAYIKFLRNGFPDFRASFHYEEMVQGCSKEIVLSDEYQLDSQQTITSPNYPNLPNPHSECIWIIRAPLHKSISIHFWGKYDLAIGSQYNICNREYIQFNDGSTEMSPLLGRYCGRTKPNSVHSSSNVIRMIYFTDLSEPHVGFKANATIARCGGSYYDSEGTIKSPEFIRFLDREEEVQCIYTIEMPVGSTISLTIDRINLPDNDNCTEDTHLELQEIDVFSSPEDNVTDILYLCGTSTNVYIVETNKLLIKFKIKKELLKSEDFQLSYSSIGTRCGETIVAAAGVLQTPGYPIGVRKPTMCSWRLKVTKGKRIKVEILDFNGNSPNTLAAHMRRRPGFPNRILFANDFAMTSVIARVLENPPAILYSTDNTMAIDAFLLSLTENRGFKLRFSSDEDSIQCHNKMYLEVSTEPRVLTFSADGNSAIYCAYNFKIEYNQTLALHVLRHEYYQTRVMYSPVWCNVLSPLALIRGENKLLPQLMCRNETQPSVRFPYSAQAILSASKQNQLKALELQYQVFKCGGFWPMDYFGKFVITEPRMTNHTGRVECAWAVMSREEKIDSADIGTIQLEVQLTTDFKGKCDDEYLIVYNGPNQNYPHFGRFCQQSSMAPMVVTGGLFFEFITNNYNSRSALNVTVTEGSGCGGKLTYPYRELTIFSRDKNNMECIWELATEPGFHLAAVFKYSFFLEDSPNCTKDYLKIQQRSPGEEWTDLKTLCGRSRPNSVNTTEVEMRVILRTDNETTGDGFTLAFDRNCGGIFYATNEMQQIHSPGYPEPYPANLTCNYTILPSKHLQDQVGGNNLLVHFLEFEVEDAPMISCRFDNVTIYATDYYGNVEKTVLCGKKSNYMVRANRAITLILRTDESFNSKGFLFEYGPNKCGGLITNSTIISSPKDYNSDKYPRSTKCIWHLNAPEHYKILLKFEELDFESQSLCTFDGIEIYQGVKEVEDQRLAKLCGNLTNHLKFMQIPQNNGLLVSYSDMHDPSKGFRVLVTFIKNCDRNIFLSTNNDSYVFNTYIEQYTNNLDCSWVFSTTSGRQLSIEFTNFHIEDSVNCKNDYLEVRDGNGVFADLIGKFCGHNTPPALMSSGRAVLMRFVTDMKDTSGGFAAVIKSVPTLCGRQSFNLDNNQTVIIKSPDDGSGKYPININCIWKVQCATFIHFEFEKLDLEGPDSNRSCSNDYLKIINNDDVEMIEKGYGSKLVFNGITPNSISSSYDFLAEHIYCGSQKPSDYFSGSKTVFIKFRSNENVTKSGFNLKATPAHGCYRNFTGVHGSIRLEEYVDHCDVYIRSPQNTTLSLYYREATFTEYDCLKEYMEVFDIHTNTSLQKICSYAEVGKALFSLTNELRLHVQLSGYYTQLSITYVASTDGPGCGGDIYNTGGVITSPFYPQNIRNNSDCRWNIRVPSNLQVLLKFLVFDLGAKSTCHTDYLQIIEYDQGGTEKIMRQFCGEDNPQNYKSGKSFLSVRFHKTVNYDGTGWVITFEGVYGNFKIV